MAPADRKRDLQQRLLATFREEAEEHLRTIQAGLLALERGLGKAEARETLEATFRAMHTLKGAARSVSLLDVEAICQASETVLSGLTRRHAAASGAVLDALQAAADGVSRLIAGSADSTIVAGLIARLEGAPTAPDAVADTPRPAALEPPPPAPASTTPAPSAETIRVATGRLDTTLLRAEELLIPKLAAEERVREAEALVEALARSRTTNGATDAGSTLRALEAQTRSLLGHLRADQWALAQSVNRLLEDIREIRMMPASAVLDLFPLMIRDLGRAHGKEVEWVAEGADVQVDRRILEAIKDPLIHLVRNAVDHGIEPPAVRVAQGKPRQGRVAVSVRLLDGGRIEIQVTDDGCGIDLARVREAAVRARLLAPEAAAQLTDEQALDLIYRSGLSTSPMITDVSGHGLGLPIVRERIERLDGRIRLETRPGAGTAVRMTLPASIATFRGLLLGAGGQPFLLGTEVVERVRRLSPGDVTRVEGQEAIRTDEGPLALVRLARILGLRETDGADGDRPRPCVIVRTGDDRAALLADEILGEREVLVKDLRPPLVRVRNVAGAGLLGTGEIVLILRPADLLRAARQLPAPAPPRREPEARDRPRTVLVVDDSITTRTMEKNLLEAAGYHVRVAVDGADAWSLLKTEQFDLVVSDVDMPRMNGFELTQRIRADRALAELPVVLVTALESREDKERGIDVGANAYVIKSSFDQSNILEIIRRLL